MSTAPLLEAGPLAEYGPSTIDDYFALPEDTDHRHELINGWIVVSPGAVSPHNRIIYELQSALEDVLPNGYLTNTDIDVSMDDPKQCPRPDLIVAGEDWIYRRRPPLPAAALLLAAEVLSPSSKRMDRITKPRIYAAAGIPNYWLIELNPFNLTEFHLVGSEYEEIQRVSGDEIIVSEPFGMKINLTAARKVATRAAETI